MSGKVRRTGPSRSRVGRWASRVVGVATGVLFLSCGDSAEPTRLADAGVQVGQSTEALTADQWPSKALLATHSVWLEDRATVKGDIAVKTAASQTLSSNAELVLGADSVATGGVQADTLILRERSIVTGSATWNTLTNGGNIQGTSSSPLALPLQIEIPALPPINPGTQNVTLNGGQQSTLASGSYAVITLNSGTPSAKTKLTLSGGLYQLSTLNVGNDSRIECANECEVRVNGRVLVGSRSFVGPKPGALGVGAGNVQLIIKGANGGVGPTGSPSALSFDPDSSMHAYALVPNGTARFGDRVTLRGKVVARHAWLDQDANAEDKQLPLIVQGPSDRTVREGASAEFSVTANGAGLTYQWQRDGANIPGATGASYTLPSATMADNQRQFRVIVRNGAGSVTSGSATLTVVACLPSDTTCDGVDDDCNGQVDEDYTIACVSSNSRRLCSNAQETNVACPSGEECQAGQCVPSDGISVEFVVKLPGGVRRSEVALGATGGRVHLHEGAQVVGSAGFASLSSVGNATSNEAHLEESAKVHNVWTQGSALLEDNSHVYGNLRASGLSKSPLAIIDGVTDSIADLAPLEQVRWSAFFPPETLGIQALALGETRALQPGAYAAVTIPQNARLELEEGTYTFESLSLASEGFLSVDNSSGPVFIYILGSTTLNGSLVRDQAAANVLLATGALGTLEIASAWRGILVAPSADIVLKVAPGSEHQGSFYGRSVELEANVTVRHEPFEPVQFCSMAPTTNCDGLCPCTAGGGCESQAQCAADWVCGSLGICTCIPSCEGKNCGDTPSDGCGGLCEDYCPEQADGCVTNVECAGDTLCVEGKCLPPSCGTTACDSLECGGVCGECTPECGGRECGPDPLCGVPCGSCAGDLACDNGVCLDPDEARPEFPPHPGTQDGASTIGAIGGEFAVSTTGRANYTMPIEVPVGRSGLQPSLALTYAGSSSPGLVGAGWSISGLSSIARCKKTIAVDGWPEAIEGDDSAPDPEDRDAICLDGQRLVLVEGEHLREGARYRTEVESFRDITFRSDGAATSWEVRDKDGTYHRYGPQHPWFMEGEVPLKWPLVETRNRAQVAIDYYYECRGWSVDRVCRSEPLISAISYGRVLNGNPSQGATHTVRFVYEPREQIYSGSAIAPGTAPRLTERLSSIEVLGSAGYMYRYALGYSPVRSGLVGQSFRQDFLTTVTQCVIEPDGERCLSPTRFEYAQTEVPGNGEVFSEFEPAQEQVVPWPTTFGGGPVDKSDTERTRQANAKPTLMLDWNGDSRPDFLHPDMDGAWALSLATMSDEVLFAGPFPVDLDLRCVSPASIADFNGDGRSDILEGCVDPDEGLALWISTGLPEAPFSGYFMPVSDDHDSAVALDVDANGVSEVVTCNVPVGPSEPNSVLWQNESDVFNGLDFGVVGALPPRDSNGIFNWCVLGGRDPVEYREAPLFGDLDADGTANIVAAPYDTQLGKGPRQYLSIRKGFEMEWRTTAAEALTSWPHPVRTLDVNGDGLTDYLLNEAYDPMNGETVFDTSRSGNQELGYRTTLYLDTLQGSMLPVRVYLPRLEAGLTNVEDTTDPLASGVTHELFGRLRVMDVDRDGKDELIGFGPTSDLLHALVNVDAAELDPTSIRFSARPMFGASSEDRFLERGITPIAVDFNGDGAQDLLQYSVDDNTVHIHRGKQPERFLLSSVVDGLGNRIDLEYGTESAYAPTAELEQHRRCLPSVGPLVEFATFRNGNGDIDSKTEFKYADARIGRYGRGPLGFGVRSMSEFVLNAERFVRSVVEEYDNGITFAEEFRSFPFAGMLLRSTTITASADSGLGDSGVLPTPFMTVVTHEYATLRSDAGLPFAVPVLSRTGQYQLIDGVDLLLSGNIVRRPASDFDVYGNQLSQVTEAYDGDGIETDRVVTQNQFYPRGQRNENNSGDPRRWEVGLLRERTVTHRGQTRKLAFEYDEETGLLARRVRAPGQPAFEQIGDLIYDEAGNIVQARVEADGVIKDTFLEYVDAFRLASVTGPSGLVAQLQVDGPTGLPLAELDPNGSAVQHAYDRFGREVLTISPTGYVRIELREPTESESGSDPLPLPGAAYEVRREQVDPSASTWSEAELDSKGRTLRTRWVGLDGVELVQTEGYDDSGLPARTDGPYPAGETNPTRSVRLYDPLGSLRMTVTPGDAGDPARQTFFEYATRYTIPEELLPEQQPGEPLITYIARKIDADGNVTTTYSGPQQQALVRVQGQGDEREEMRMGYGAFGEVSDLTGANNVMIIQRDVWGRVTAVSDNDIGTLSYTYDPFDRLIQAIDADSTTTGYEYDVLDRLIRVVHNAEEERFIFDRDLEAEADGEPIAENALGRLVRSVRTTPNGTFTQRYAYQPRPTNENPLANRALLEAVELETPTESFEMRYEYYSGTARVAAQYYPGVGDFAVSYCYDEFGALSHVFDAFDAGNCTDPEAPGATPYWKRTSTFRGMGVNGIELGNGVATSIDLDPNTMRLMGQTFAGPESSMSFAYDYEPGGRLARETRLSSAVVGGISFDHASTYGAGGLLSSIADASSGAALYDPTYSPQKQLETGPGDLGTFVYDGADGSPLGNRLRRVEPPPSAPEQAPHLFEYDGRGNQTLRTGPRIPGGEQSISYNVFNLPDTITTGTGATAFSVAFDYDASGSRVHTLRSESEIWHFGGVYEKELRATDPDIAEEHRFSVIAGGERVALVTRARGPSEATYVDTVTYLHHDRKGSVVALSDSTGNITTELDYEVYGEPKQPMPIAWGYTGHRHEQDIGLVDAGGRFYDPLFGVFLSADPISPLGGSSPRLNRYAYVGYDPVNFIDPTGLFLEDIWNFAKDFASQAWGYTYGWQLNLVATGRLQTTWDEKTTEGAITLAIGIAAGVACGAATANPVVGATCAGAATGAFGVVVASRGKADWGQIAYGAGMGATFGMLGGTAGAFANSAVYSLTSSHAYGSLAAAGAASGANVGLQLATGQEVNWAQVAANGIVSGVLAWVDGAQQDAAAAEVSQAAGAAAGASSDATAGHTRARIEAQRTVARLLASNPDAMQGAVACFPACALNPWEAFPNTPWGQAMAEWYFGSYEVVGNLLLAATDVAAVGTAVAARGAMTAARGAGTAFKIAKAGGRHAGLLKTYAGRSAAELQKGIASLEGRAAEHAAKVANPAQFAERWGQMGAQEQAGLLRYWQKEAANYGEQAEVLRGLLGSL